jgi:Plant transposon protein
LAVPIGKENKRFAAWQESSCKDIKRTFRILQRKFHYLVWPFEQWELEEIKDIMLTCILMHNWMVTVRIERDELETADFYALVEPDAADEHPMNEDADLEVMHNDDAHFAVIENLNAYTQPSRTNITGGVARQGGMGANDAAIVHAFLGDLVLELSPHGRFQLQL